MRQDELESAIARYSRAEPRAGIEARVMARVRITPPKRRWRPIAVVLALGCMAASLFVLTMPAPTKPAIVAPSFPVAAALYVPIRTLQGKRAHRKLSRPKQFPTPVPLTASERAMLEFFDTAPEVVRNSFLHGPELEVQEIVIKPLQTESRP